MQFIYHTNRLILRILTPECAPLVNKFYQDNRKFLEPFEPNRPGNFYTNDFHYCNLRCEYDAFLRLSYFRYWIFCKENSDFPIGCICFSNILLGAFRKCMLGYKLGEYSCHKGYMLEALAALIPMVMQEINLHRIEAYVQPDNAPSIRLLTRLGFQEEGYLQKYAEIHGKWTDHLIFSYLKKDALPEAPKTSSQRHLAASRSLQWIENPKIRI